jgi:hypothetical protein
MTLVQQLHQAVSDAETAYLTLSGRIDGAIARMIENQEPHTPTVSAADLVALLREIRGN